MAMIFRMVRFVAIALATVAMGKRAWKQFRNIKED